MDASSPHLLVLPFPTQGHINPMLNLAELLSRAGFKITFVNTEHNDRRGGGAFRRRSPDIDFVSIPDGLPADHPRAGVVGAVELFASIGSACEPALKELIGGMSYKPTCVLADGIMSTAIDVAEEFGIPAISFGTYSGTCTWVYLHVGKLIEDGEVPFVAGKEDMDKLISTNIPGLKNILRRRDLSNFCRLEPRNLPVLQFFNTQTSIMTKASALILNTFEELESPIISHLHSIFPKVYTIGPLQAFAKQDSSNLIKTDKSCIEWLDCQPYKSVLYVSFGSVVVLSENELMEFWHGLVNSGKRFLWAVRSDLIGPDKIPNELMKGTEVMGRIVGWAPQEDALAHDAVGGFLTHSGWNSMLESMSAGKPMICWPKIADQQVNSRCVSEIWGIGVDMKDTCDRLTVEKMVRDLMDGRREDIVKSTNKIARFAQASVQDGGSSHRNINKLVEDIKLLHSKKCSQGQQ